MVPRPSTSRPPSNNQFSPKKNNYKENVTHDDERDLGPVRPRERPQLSTDRRDLFDARALPDTARKVLPTIDGLKRLEQVQRRRVQLPLVQHGVRRVVQQPGIRAMRIELDDLGQPPVSAPNDGDAGAIALSIMLPRPSRCTGIRV